jgi:hypothetical protein
MSVSDMRKSSTYLKQTWANLRIAEADMRKICAHVCTWGGLFVPGWQYRFNHGGALLIFQGFRLKPLAKLQSSCFFLKRQQNNDFILKNTKTRNKT